MSEAAETPHNLESRFCEPEGWRWHHFSHKGRALRFGSVFPKDQIPDAIVVCLPGLGEFCEKYFETARTCLSKNMAFWVLDWVGQGASTRLLKNPQKRHSEGFQADIDDLHYFIMEYIKHASVHPDKGRIPLVMLAQSMGGNIGLRYIQQHPDMFACAAFCAPMFGLKPLSSLPVFLARIVTGVMNGLAGKCYVYGEADWRSEMRPDEGPRLLSSDPVRNKIHAAWFAAKPALQMGFVTYGWVYQAFLSCLRLDNSKKLKAIKIPCLIAQAGLEHLVDNKKMTEISQKIEHVDFLVLPESRHEILMERDAIRDVFFAHFEALIRKSILERPHTLKPF